MLNTKKLYACPTCYATAEECDKLFKWRYANPYNSTHFCRCCGSAMSQYELTEDEIKRYEFKHEEWLKDKSNKNKFF